MSVVFHKYYKTFHKKFIRILMLYPYKMFQISKSNDPLVMTLNKGKFRPTYYSVLDKNVDKSCTYFEALYIKLR